MAKTIKKKRTAKELQQQVDQAMIIFTAQRVQCLDAYWGPLMDQAIKKFMKDNTTNHGTNK